MSKGPVLIWVVPRTVTRASDARPVNLSGVDSDLLNLRLQEVTDLNRRRCPFANR